MAIVRPFRPNLAEMCVYRPFLDRFDLTFYFTGMNPDTCRRELDSMGLQGMKAVRYASYTDLISWNIVQRFIDYKVGFGSYMLSHLRDVLYHDYINVVDPIFGFTHQVARLIRSGQKLIVVRWENIYGRYDRVWMAARGASRVLERADVVVCVSQAAAATLRLPPAFKGNVVQIYPAIDMRSVPSNGFRATAKGPQSAEERRPVVLFVGRLQWTKGLQALLVALRILRQKKRIEADLWVIGGGDNIPFKALAEELGLQERVRFFGTLSNAEVRGKMAEADLFCFPSLLSPNWMEQYGFSVVEAMAHGLPVVTFDSGSIREICGEGAVYASTGNAHSLAEAIAGVIQNSPDALERGKRLRQRALREFDADGQGMKMLEAVL